MSTEWFCEQVQTEGKLLTCSLMENDHGPFLEITGEIGNRRYAVTVSSSGPGKWRDAAERLIRAHRESPCDYAASMA